MVYKYFVSFTVNSSSSTHIHKHTVINLDYQVDSEKRVSQLEEDVKKQENEDEEISLQNFILISTITEVELG